MQVPDFLHKFRNPLETSEQLWSGEEISQCLLQCLHSLSELEPLKTRGSHVIAEDILPHLGAEGDAPVARLLRLEWKERDNILSMNIIFPPLTPKKESTIEILILSGARLDAVRQNPTSKNIFYRSSSSTFIDRGASQREILEKLLQELRVHEINPARYQELKVPVPSPQPTLATVEV